MRSGSKEGSYLRLIDRLVYHSTLGCGVTKKKKQNDSGKGHGATPEEPARSYVCSADTHPAPCTLHPTPHTLQLSPFNLHPSPYTLHPTPFTLRPTPYTLHSTLCNLHPTSCTLHSTRKSSEESRPQRHPTKRGYPGEQNKTLLKGFVGLGGRALR
jgi:hypothetical protein